MYTVTTYSNRFYVDDYNIDINSFSNSVDNTIHLFNKAVYYTYNLVYYKQFNVERYRGLIGTDKTVFIHIRNKFGYNTYYCNSIINIAEGMLKSQISNNKNYVQQTNAQISAVDDKINKRTKYLNDLIKMRDRILLYEQLIKQCKSVNFKSVRSLRNVSYENNLIKITDKNKVGYISIYKFEYEFLNKEIKRIKNLIGKYKHRIDNLMHKLNRLKTIKPIIFGGYKFLSDYCKGLYTRKQFELHKYNQFNVSGRHDFPTGNRMFNAIYNKTNNSFTIVITFIDGKKFILNNVKFPYRQSELLKILSRETNDGKMKAICFGICKKRDIVNGKIYYQIKTSFDLESVQNNLNHNIDTGVIGIDFNVGHLDMCEIDSRGNILHTKTIYYDVYSNSAENELSLRKALDIIGNYAKSKHKIIAVEDVNTYKSTIQHCKDKTRQRKLNKALHSLPHAKYLSYVKYLKIKYGFDIIVVKPQFTSVIGKFKYAKQKKLNNHIAASYVIARRALGFSEKLLKQQVSNLPKNIIMANEWKRWSYVNKNFK